MLIGYELIKFDADSPNYHILGDDPFGASLCKKQLLSRFIVCDEEDIPKIVDCKNCLDEFQRSKNG